MGSIGEGDAVRASRKSEVRPPKFELLFTANGREWTRMKRDDIGADVGFVAQTAGLLYRRLPSRRTPRRPAACDTADQRSALRLASAQFICYSTAMIKSGVSAV